ncbi:hypothetical protein [uncultured Methylobacterium sp.]|uniref:hypothetical protein n=1 Tax=uncultured Methylobacterium sp. TaxID=157278 RepID=UPI0035CB7FCF
MIETIMIFALGFLLASLCALFILPAVNARAARLARQRMASLFPLTSVEIAAEKDYLRAQFAVERRQLERRVQAIGATKHADMATIGVRTLEAAALARTVTEREATLTVKDGEIAAALGERDRVAQDLQVSRDEFAVGTSTLQVLEDAHRALLDDFLRARRQRDSVTAETMAAIDPVSATDTTLASREEATGTPPGDVAARIAALEAERESLRSRLAAAETDLARASDAGARETAALRDSITAVADALVRGERLPSVTAFPISTPAAKTS